MGKIFTKQNKAIFETPCKIRGFILHIFHILYNLVHLWCTQNKPQTLEK